MRDHVGLMHRNDACELNLVDIQEKEITSESKKKEKEKKRERGTRKIV
jgi:hypothetical protein